MKRKLAIIGLALLLAVLDVPITPAAPLTAVTRAAVDVTLAAAPPTGGSVIEITVPADLLPNLHPSIIERPGMERRISRR